ncbi:hypothetical protein P8452_52475 [Trifolium repens]|nr:hypothetical protein P8452_52475 [Trifolium repens]
MDFNDSLSEEIGTNHPRGADKTTNGDERIFTSKLHEISSDKDNSEVGSRSEACSHDSLLNAVVNELKELTTKVAAMDATNSKMIEILIGLVKLEINVPTKETNSPPFQTKQPETPSAAFDNTSTTMNNSVNVPNNYKTPYLGKQPIFNDISTVFVSYDDDKIETDAHIDEVRPYEHEMHYNIPKKTYNGPTNLCFDSDADDGSINEIPASKFFAGSTSYKRSKEIVNESTMIPKKLSFTPAPLPGKKMKCATQVGGTVRKSILSSPLANNGSSKKPPRSYKFKPNMPILPKFMKSKFRPTAQMRLKQDQLKMVAYIFREDADNKDEVVFAVGNDLEMRSEFQHLIPGGYVGMTILKMMAMRVTWNQSHAMTPSLWCLPPTFAREALAGYGPEKLGIIYQHIYMPAIQTLKLIYIPMEDACGHWFLMVIHIEERKIYHLDSFLVAGQIEGRRQQIRKIASVISHMLLLIYNMEMTFCSLPDFEQWDIIEPRGIPNCGHSENSGLWVAEWLNMQQSFNSQIIGVLVDQTVRIKLALKLLMGPHNGCRQVLETKAADYWDKVTNGTT